MELPLWNLHLDSWHVRVVRDEGVVKDNPLQEIFQQRFCPYRRTVTDLSDGQGGSRHLSQNPVCGTVELVGLPHLLVGRIVGILTVLCSGSDFGGLMTRWTE